MEITLPGIILIPIGLFLLFVLPKYLYYFTIFFIPFSATSLLNSASGAPLIAVQFFGTLLIVKELFFTAGMPKSHEDKSPATRRSMIYMCLFAIVAIMSMVMPYIIDGKFYIYNHKFPDLEEVPVFLTSQNIKNPLPVIFGMLLAYIVIKKNRSLPKLEITAKIFIASVVFVTAWGLIQLCFKLVGIEIPANLFNTAIHDAVANVSATTEVVDKDLLRITSVTLEPSLVSQALLSVIPIYLIFFASGGKIFSPILDKIFFGCMVFLLLVSTSTTAYVGFLVVFILFFWISNRVKMQNTKKIFILGIVALLVLLISLFLLTGVRNYLDVVLFDKSDSISALARTYSVVTAWDYFLQYPILGLGLGIVTSNDLVVWILANTGIVGLFVFAKLIVIIFKESMRSLRYLEEKKYHPSENMTRWLTGFVLSLSTYLIVSAFTSFTYYLPLFYFLLGVLIAFNSVIHPKTIIRDS